MHFLIPRIRPERKTDDIYQGLTVEPVATRERIQTLNVTQLVTPIFMLITAPDLAHTHAVPLNT